MIRRGDHYRRLARSLVGRVSLVFVFALSPLPARSSEEDLLAKLSSSSTAADFNGVTNAYFAQAQTYANLALQKLDEMPLAAVDRIRADLENCIDNFEVKGGDAVAAVEKRWDGCFKKIPRSKAAEATDEQFKVMMSAFRGMVFTQAKAFQSYDACTANAKVAACMTKAAFIAKFDKIKPTAVQEVTRSRQAKGGGKKSGTAAAAGSTAGGAPDGDGEGKPGPKAQGASAQTVAAQRADGGLPPPPSGQVSRKLPEGGSDLGRAQKAGGSGFTGSTDGKAGGDRNSKHAKGRDNGFENAEPIEGAKEAPPFDSTDRCELEAKKEKARQANATPRGPCPSPAGAPSAVTNLGAAFGELGMKVKAEDQAAKLKLAISRLRLQQYAESYLKTLSRKTGMSSMEYKRKMDELVNSCSGPSADVLKKDLQGLVGPLEKEIDSAKFENGRQAYSKGAMDAATELAQYDAKIKTLMGDFPQAPEEMVAHYPPFMPCRTILTVLDQFDSAFSKLGSRAECGPWRGGAFGGKLETCNVESENISAEAKAKGREAVYTEYTPADQLLVEMKMVKPQTGSGAQGRECFASRCEKKKAILEVMAVKRAEVLSRYPELAYNTQADGKLIETKTLGGATGTACGAKADLDYWDKKLPVSPSALAFGASAQLSAANAAAMKASSGYRQRYEGLKQACAQDKPVYQHLNDQPTGKAATDIFDRHLQGNMIGKELDANLGRVKAICKDPFAEAEDNFKDDAQLNGILNCSVEPAADASPAWKEVAERQAARCAEIKRDPKLACETREAVRNTGSEKAKEVGKIAFEVGMTYMDLSSCFNLVGGMARGFARAAAGESASVLAKESGSAVLNGIKGLNPGNALKTIATSRNLGEIAKAGQQLIMTQGLAAHGIYSALSADRIAEKAIADCSTGNLTGDDCKAAQNAAKENWNAAVRDFALGMLVPALEAPGHAGAGHGPGHGSGHGPGGSSHESSLGRLHRESEAHPNDPTKRAQLDQALARELHDPRSREILRARITELHRSGEITSAQADHLRTTIEKGSDAVARAPASTPASAESLRSALKIANYGAAIEKLSPAQLRPLVEAERKLANTFKKNPEVLGYLREQNLKRASEGSCP